MKPSGYKQKNSALYWPLLLLLGLAFGCSNSSSDATQASRTLYVPTTYPTIQSAIDSAHDDDIIIVENGIYYENLSISNKRITLASNYYQTGNERDINTTVIDGNRTTVINVDASSAGTSVIGLTIQHGDDGLSPSAKINILNNFIKNNVDGIDYEGGGGICRNNIIRNNSDDAIDLDGSTEVTIEGNDLSDNADDGIEIRLHPYTGRTLLIDIRNNRITGNGEDGIQLIGYNTTTDRKFTIHRNLLAKNAKAAIGLMGSKNTVEDYSGAPLKEEIAITNNTFSDNNYGITGGANTLVVNNIFRSTAHSAVKNILDDALIDNNLFWDNGTNLVNSNADADKIVFDPLLDTDYAPLPESPAIDKGKETIYWKDKNVTLTDAYHGISPDLGFMEYE